jgi:hypothetical protein
MTNFFKNTFHLFAILSFREKILIIPSFYIIVLIISACSNATNPDESSVIIKTGQEEYLQTDTINVILSNHTSDNYLYALRCGGYLEMFFQKLEKGTWSENKWFWYMSLRCPSVIDTLKPGDSFKYALPAEWFKDSGSFRLIMDDLHSNTFTIE